MALSIDLQFEDDHECQAFSLLFCLLEESVFLCYHLPEQFL